ncbi:MAG: MFS transporter [Gammaproteobacteria bacterium]|nr:MFS transporter [Gammaproteobacteria bacterium]
MAEIETGYTESIIRKKIDQGSISLTQVLIVLICFLLNVADGFDVVAISMAAPHIAAEWQIDAKILGVVLSAELVGMLLGAVVLASLSDSKGRRKVLIFSVAAISLSMLLTTQATNITQLIIMRVITGLGVGGILTSAAAIASEFAPSKYRNMAVIIVTSGFACGALGIGPVAAYFLKVGDWQSVFLIGGIMGLVLLAMVITFIPESMEFIAKQQGDKQTQLRKINSILSRLHLESLSELPDQDTKNSTGAKQIIRSLLGPKYRNHTLRLWLIFFLGYWVCYLLMKWIPKLFVNMGYDISTGVYALTIFTLGGLFGNILVAILSTRFRITYILTTMFVFCGILLLLYSTWKPTGITTLYVLLFLINSCLTGPLTGMYAVSTNSYPSELRASGLGWCLGVGRTGSIASPIAAGFLIAAGWNMYGLFLLFGVPTILAAAFLIKGIRQRSPNA